MIWLCVDFCRSFGAQALSHFGFVDESSASPVWPKVTTLLSTMRSTPGISYGTFAPPVYDVFHRAVVPFFINYTACEAMTKDTLKDDVSIAEIGSQFAKFRASSLQPSDFDELKACFSDDCHLPSRACSDPSCGRRKFRFGACLSNGRSSIPFVTRRKIAPDFSSTRGGTCHAVPLISDPFSLSFTIRFVYF